MRQRSLHRRQKQEAKRQSRKGDGTKLVRWRVLETMAVLLLLASCMGARPGGGVYFLQQKPSDAPDMEALYEGRLVLSERCLYLRSEDGNLTHAAIWPLEFSLTVQGDSIQILNGDKEVVARVGDQVLVGGGEIPPLSREEFEQRFLGPFQCAGSYWLVTEVVETTP